MIADHRLISVTTVADVSRETAEVTELSVDAAEILRIVARFLRESG